MSNDSPKLRLTRTGIFIILAALVALLGAAAKHSQFDGTSHTGYLSKAVKMAGTRVQPDLEGHVGQLAISQVTVFPLEAGRQPVLAVHVTARITPISVSSPPLRV